MARSYKNSSRSFRNKEEEEEKQIAQPEQPEPPAEEPPQPEAPASEPVQAAQAKQPKQVSIEKTENGVTAHIGPTNRQTPGMHDLMVANAYKEASTQLVNAGALDQLPEELQDNADELAKKNKAGGFTPAMTGRYSSESNKINVDYGSIKNDTHAMYFAMNLANDKQRAKFLEEYAEHKGLDAQGLLYNAEQTFGNKMFSNPQSNKGKLAAAGLYNFDGTEMDPNTITSAESLRALRMTPDDDPNKKNAIKAHRDMFGYLPDEEFDFMDTADLTKDDYKDEVDSFKSAFVFSDGVTDQNRTAYEEQLDRINNYYSDRNPWVAKKLKSALDREFAARTGVLPPDENELRRLREEAAAAEAALAENDTEDNRNWFQKIIDDISDAYNRTEKVPKAEEPQEQEDEEAPEAGAVVRPGYYASTGVASGGSGAPASSYAAAGSAPEIQGPQYQPQTAQEEPEEPAEVQGPVYQPQAQEQEETPQESSEPRYVNAIPYDPDMTDAQALAYHKRGATLDPRNAEQIAWFVGNRNAMSIVSGYAPGFNTPSVMNNTEAKMHEAFSVYGQYGSEIGNAILSINNGSLPEEAQNIATLELGSVIVEIDRIVADPRNNITVPGKQNMYTYVLSLPEYEPLLNRVNAVKDVQSQVNAAYAEQAQKEAEAKQALVDSAKARVAAGNATADDIALIAEATTASDYVDLCEDEMYVVFRAQMNPMRINFFGDEKPFWQNGSAAAQEGLNLKKTGGAYSVYSEYKSDLMRETKRVLDDYTETAIMLGMTLEEYLGSAGIDSLEQIVDIAYNNMQATGNAYRTDTQAQEAAAEIAVSSVGKTSALLMGAESGAKSYAADFAQTAYMALDEATYNLERTEIMNQYVEDYGYEQAAAMYYNDLMAYANSGKMDEASKADLLDHIARATNIFDVAFEIDATGIEGWARAKNYELQKDVDALAEIAQTMPRAERVLFDMAHSTVNSGIGMAVSTITGGATGSALVGTAVGFGTGEWANAYDENRAKGMSPGMAGWMAMGNAAISTLVNVGGTGSQMELYFGGDAYRVFREALMNEGGIGLVKAIGGEIASKAHEEGAEEVTELLAGKAFDLLDKEALAIDSGAGLSLSRTLSGIAQSLEESDPAALFREVVSSYGMGAALGGLFSVAGVAKTAVQARKGVNAQTKYNSVDLAMQIAEGKLEFTEENAGKAIAALQKDLEDPKFRRWIDSASKAATEQRAVVTAMMNDAGSEERQAAVKEAQRANEYAEKAAAATQAAENATNRWIELRQQVANGDVGQKAALESARMLMGKANQAKHEATTAAQKARESARNHMQKWIAASMEQSGIYKSQAMQMRVNQIAEERMQLAQRLAAQYEAEEAARAAEEARYEASAAEGAEYAESRVFAEEEWAEEEENAEEANAEEAYADLESALNYAETIAQQKEFGETTEDEEEELTSIREYSLRRMLDLMTRAKYALDDLGDITAYNELVREYNKLRHRVSNVYELGKLTPVMEEKAEPDFVLPEMPEMSPRIRELYAKQAEREARQREEIEMNERAVFGEPEDWTETEDVVSDGTSFVNEDEEIQELFRSIEEAEQRVENVLSNGESAGMTKEQIDEYAESERMPLRERKNGIIAREKARFNDAFERMQTALENDAGDAADQIAEEYDRIAERLNALGVNTDALIAEQYGYTLAELDEGYAQAQAQEAQRAETEKQERLTDTLQRQMHETAEKIEQNKSARRYLMDHPIYVNESQVADILAAEELKSIPQVNRRYHMQLTTDEKANAMPLDGHVMNDINSEAAGSVDESADPVGELLRIMQTGKELAAEQRAQKQEAKELQRKRKETEDNRKKRVKEVARPAGTVDAVVSAQSQNTEAANDAQVDAAQAAANTPAQATQQLSKKGKKLEANALKAVQELADTIGVGFRIKSDARFQSADARMSKGALGYYKNGQRNAIVRSKEAGKLEVSGHEIGHAVQEQLGIHSTKTMIDSWQKHFPNTSAYTPQQYDHEAFAEFFWRYLKGRNVAATYTDGASVDAFEYALRKDKKLRKAVEKAQEQVSSYFNSSDTGARIQANIVTMAEANKDTLFAEKARKKIAEIVDDTSAFEPMQDVIRARIGEKHLGYKLNLRDTIRYNRRASGRAEQCVSVAMVDNDGNAVGESLKDVFSEIKGKDYDLYMQWWLARHSLDRDKRKYEKNLKESGGDAQKAKPGKDQVFAESDISTAEREKFIAETEKAHPEFAKTNERFQKWRRLFLETYLVDNGLMGKPSQARAMLDMLEQIYPYYAPTKRAGKGKNGTSVTGGTRGQKTYAMREATGSTEQIIDPFESFVEMINSVVSLAAENDNKRKFARLYDLFSGAAPGHPGAGMGLFANEITQDMRKNVVDVTAMRKKIEKMLDEIDTDPEVIMQISDLIGDERAQYRGTGHVDMDNVIRVRDLLGEDRYFEVYNPEIYELLANVSGQSDKSDGAPKMFSSLTRAMSMLTTGSNPVFGITNAMRDFQNSVNYGSWAKSYIDGAAKWLATLKDVVLNTEISKEYDAMGGGGWTRYETRTRKGAERTKSEVFKGYNRKNIGQIGKTAGRALWRVATMEDLNGAIEKTSRLAEYKYGKHDRTTTEGKIEAFLASQDVTTDFARHGSSRLAKDLKYVVPFFNASTQGVYRNARQFTAQESDQAKARLAKQIVNTTLASLLANGLMMLYLDDDEKEEFTYLSEDLTAKHMFIPNFAPDVFGDAMLIRIPLDQNPISYAVNAAVSNMVWKGETGDDFLVGMAALSDVIFDNLCTVNSTILDPVVSVMSNKNWYGSKIVPTYLESYDALNQYTEETPAPFVAGAEILSGLTFGKARISPMMLQYLAEQYTGYVGQAIIPALPSEKNKDGILTGMWNALVATSRKRITSDPLKSNDVISAVYDNFNVLQAVSKAGRSARDFEIDYLKPTLTEAQRARAVEEAYRLTHSKGDLYEAKKELGELDDEIDAINARTDLTDRQKHLLASDVRREKIEIALDVQEVVDDYNARYKYEGLLPRFFAKVLSE